MYEAFIINHVPEGLSVEESCRRKAEVGEVSGASLWVRLTTT